MEFIGNNRRQCNSNGARPFEKGRPGLQVVSVPERTQVGDGVPRHRGRDSVAWRPQSCPHPASPFLSSSWLRARLSSRVQTGSPTLSWSFRGPGRPRTVRHPGRGGGCGGRGSQQPGMGPVGFCWSITRFKVQLAF